MKKMLIDDTQPEETRVVILDGNRIEDVAFESSAKKQIKGNIFNAKVVRIEPSLQAAFVDYGGNRHGFLAFGEIHPDYYNVSDEVKAEVEAEVDEIIERKRRFHAERKAEQERRKLEREQKRAEYEARQLALQASEAAEAGDGLEDEQTEELSVQAEEQAPEATVSATVDFDEATDVEIEEAADCGCDEDCACRQEDGQCHCVENGQCSCGEKTDCGCDEDCACRQGDGQCHCVENGQCSCGEKGSDVENVVDETATDEVEQSEEVVEAEGESEEKTRRNVRRRGARFLGRRGGNKKFKVSAEAAGTACAMVSEDVEEKDVVDDGDEFDDDNDDSFDDDGDDTDFERYLEIQRKLIYSRKLYYRSAIQDVIKEGQTLLIQIVK